MLPIDQVRSLIASGMTLSDYASSQDPEGTLRIAEGRKAASESRLLAITDGRSESSKKSKLVQGRDVQGKQTQAV
jgi:riboflavin biosynthesis pyrimidine reductase